MNCQQLKNQLNAASGHAPMKMDRMRLIFRKSKPDPRMFRRSLPPWWPLQRAWVSHPPDLQPGFQVRAAEGMEETGLFTDIQHLPGSFIALAGF